MGSLEFGLAFAWARGELGTKRGLYNRLFIFIRQWVWIEHPWIYGICDSDKWAWDYGYSLDIYMYTL